MKLSAKLQGGNHPNNHTDMLGANLNEYPNGLFATHIEMQQLDPELLEERMKIAGQIRRTSNRIKELLRRIEELDQLDSVSSQVEAYGAEEWNGTFTRLIETSDEKDQQCTWRRLPDGSFKRFQEAFCHPHNFVVPSMALNSGQNFRGMSVAGCLPSADRIPDELAQKLGLVSFNGEGPWDRLKAKAQLRVLQQLKKLWDSTEQLSGGSQRLRIIQPSNNELRDRYPDDVPDPSAIGSILYLCEPNNGNGNSNGSFREQQVQFFGSIYAAHRATLHKRKNYAEESPRLQQTAGETRSLIREINENGLNYELLEAAAELSDRAADRMPQPVDSNKQDARRFLGEAAIGIDSLGRPNSSRSLSKMTAAKNRCLDRHGEAIGKSICNEEDSACIRRTIENSERILRVFQENFVNTNGNPPSESAKNGDRRQKRFGFYSHNLDRVKVAPLCTYALALSHCYECNKDGIEPDRQIELMKTIGNILCVRQRFEHIKERIIDPDQFCFRKACGEVDSLLLKLRSKKDLLPDGLFAQLEGISRKLRYYIRVEDDKNADEVTPFRIEVYERFKKYLDTIDLEEMVFGVALIEKIPVCL